VRGLLERARLVPLTVRAVRQTAGLAVAGGFSSLPGGVWLSIWPSRRPALVPQAWVRRWGAGEPGRSIHATLAEHLAHKHLLAMLDTARPDRRCAGLSPPSCTMRSAAYLTTSREGWVPGETTFRVRPPVPDRAHPDIHRPTRQLAALSVTTLRGSRGSTSPRLPLTARTAPAWPDLYSAGCIPAMSWRRAWARSGKASRHDWAIASGADSGPRTVLPASKTCERPGLDHDLLE